MCWLSRRQAAARSIQWVLGEWKRQTGLSGRMATLTVRHSASDPASLALGVRAAWRRCQQTGSWKRYRRRTGLEAIIAEEVTHGRNGWHPHLHLAVLQRSQPELAEDADHWYECWADAVELELGKEHTPLPDIGTDLRPCFAGEYLAKLGLELADPGGVKGRGGDELADPAPDNRKGRSPLELVYCGELERYMELQLSRKRARDITYSRGLKDIRELEPKPVMDVRELDVLPSDFELVKHRRGDKGLLMVLQAAEQEGLTQADELINRLSLHVQPCAATDAH